MMTRGFKAITESMRDELIARRRDLHQHPELAFEEVRTSNIIAEELNKLGLEVQTGMGKTGVVAVLEGDHDGPTVMYRADMDALPIEEENDVDYRSTVPGVMHACGHDGHVTIALGVAKLMSQYRQDIKGRIKFVFQPAEEGAGGAKAMIEDGVLHNPTPEIGLGLHIWNPLPVGKVGVTEGAMMSGASSFHIMIQGRGGHAAMPHTAVDTVVCTSQLIPALHMIPGRRLNALDGAVVLSVSGVKTSSFAHNVIPESVEITGTFRTLNAEATDQIERHIHDVSRSVCVAAGCTAEVTVRHLTIPVINHPDVVKRVRRAFARVVDPNTAFDFQVRTMASEDVSYLTADIPSMYFFVGGSNPEQDLIYGHHHPRFDFDENALPLGVALMAAALAEYVLPLPEEAS